MTTEVTVSETQVEKKDPMKFTLPELVQNFQQIRDLVEQENPEGVDDIDELYVVAKNLLSGKVDRVASFLNAIDAHRAACQRQIERLDFSKEMIETHIQTTMEASKEKQLNGNAYRFRLHKNTPSVEIKDETQIPAEYKRVKVDISDSFDFTNKEQLQYYQTFLLQRLVDEQNPVTTEDSTRLDKYITVEVSKSKIKEAFKLKKDVPGAGLTQGQHLRIEAGKATKAKLTEEPAQSAVTA